MVHPKVTVFMPVLNGEEHVHDAIDSILSQDYKDFEFIIVDDGSRDKTQDILKSYDDSRIKVITNQSNKGILFCNNLALEEARGDYFARMDADDISFPDRLSSQVDYMDQSEDIVVLGGYLQIEEDGGIWETFCSHDLIRCDLLFHCNIWQPTTLFRMNFFRERNIKYEGTYPRSMDYHLWLRLAHTPGALLANLGKVLLRRKMNVKGRIGVKYSDQQIRSTFRLYLKELANLGIIPTKEELALHFKLGRSLPLKDAREVGSVLDWLEKLHQANIKKSIYNDKDFLFVLNFYIHKIFRQVFKPSLSLYNELKKSKLVRELSINYDKLFAVNTKRWQELPENDVQYKQVV